MNILTIHQLIGVENLVNECNLSLSQVRKRKDGTVYGGDGYHYILSQMVVDKLEKIVADPKNNVSDCVKALGGAKGIDWCRAHTVYQWNTTSNELGPTADQLQRLTKEVGKVLIQERKLLTPYRIIQVQDNCAKFVYERAGSIQDVMDLLDVDRTGIVSRRKEARTGVRGTRGSNTHVELRFLASSILEDYIKYENWDGPWGGDDLVRYMHLTGLRKGEIVQKLKVSNSRTSKWKRDGLTKQRIPQFQEMFRKGYEIFKRKVMV